jgi:hypothetical protein
LIVSPAADAWVAGIATAPINAAPSTQPNHFILKFSIWETPLSAFIIAPESLPSDSRRRRAICDAAPDRPVSGARAGPAATIAETSAEDGGKAACTDLWSDRAAVTGRESRNAWYVYDTTVPALGRIAQFENAAHLTVSADAAGCAVWTGCVRAEVRFMTSSPAGGAGFRIAQGGIALRTFFVRLAP